MRCIKGNILDSDAKALVCPVNCLGDIAGELFIQFKEKFPDMPAYYRQACDAGGIQIGSIWMYCENELWLFGFPVNYDWRDSPTIENIRKGLMALHKVIGILSIRSIAIPQLGCGDGGLDWKDVHGIIIDLLGDLHDVVDIQIYEPMA